MYQQILETLLEYLSSGRVLTNVSTNISTDINLNTNGEGKVSLKHWCIISEVSVNHQVYRPIGVSVDIMVDTWSMYRPILDRSSVDWSIGWYIDRCICCKPPITYVIPNHYLGWGMSVAFDLTFLPGGREFDSNFFWKMSNPCPVPPLHRLDIDRCITNIG